MTIGTRYWQRGWECAGHDGIIRVDRAEDGEGWIVSGYGWQEGPFASSVEARLAAERVDGHDHTSIVTAAGTAAFCAVCGETTE